MPCSQSRRSLFLISFPVVHSIPSQYVIINLALFSSCPRKNFYPLLRLQQFLSMSDLLYILDFKSQLSIPFYSPGFVLVFIPVRGFISVLIPFYLSSSIQSFPSSSMSSILNIPSSKSCLSSRLVKIHIIIIFLLFFLQLNRN